MCGKIFERKKRMEWIDIEETRQGSELSGMGVIISTKGANVPGGCIVRIFYTAVQQGFAPVVALTSTFVPDCVVTGDGKLEAVKGE